MPRFVVLHHEMPPKSARATHWDLMVEDGEKLRTWALAEEPAIGREIAATPLDDHRLAYLDYEGAVSGNRGSVTRWDLGECTITEATTHRIVVAFAGEKLVGHVEIEMQVGNSPSAIFTWRTAPPIPEPVTPDP